MESYVWIGYKDLFDDSNELSINEILMALPSKAVFNIIAFINSQIHLLNRDPNKQLELLNIWIKRLNDNDKLLILNKIETCVRAQKNIRVIFFTNLTSMTLAQKALENYNDNDRKILTSEEEFMLLKAYFMSNDILNIKQYEIVDSKKLNSCWATQDRFYHTLLLLSIAQVELLAIKPFFLQLINGYRLCEFLESSSEFSFYFKEYLNAFGFDSWKKYLFIFADIYSNLIIADKQSPSMNYAINVKPSNEKLSSFLDNLSVNVDLDKKYIEKMSDCQRLDYKPFREKPLFKIDSNIYCFLNFNFFVDKLFQSIQYNFFNYIKLNKNYNESFNTFKSIYSDKFTEKNIFFEEMEYILTDYDVKSIPGNRDHIEYSDYYIRKGNSIYLFEFKDYVIDADTKHSYNFNTLFVKLKTLFIGTDIKPKGIKQLINVMKNIRDRKILFDKINFNKTKKSKFKVYPIIVFTDMAFNCEGINNEFIILLKENRFPFKIKNLIMIDLNILMDNRELFREKKINLFDSFDDYYKFSKSEGVYKDKFLQELLGYSNFFDYYINKKKLKREVPKNFQIILKELYENNINNSEIMLNKIHEDNVHNEIDFGESVGNEIIPPFLPLDDSSDG